MGFFGVIGSFTVQAIGSIMAIIIGCIVMYMLMRRKEKKKVVGFVSGLRVYPVKSCQPLLLHTTEITPLGLKHDR